MISPSGNDARCDKVDTIGGHWQMWDEPEDTKLARLAFDDRLLRTSHTTSLLALSFRAGGRASQNGGKDTTQGWLSAIIIDQPAAAQSAARHACYSQNHRTEPSNEMVRAPHVNDDLSR